MERILIERLKNLYEDLLCASKSVQTDRVRVQALQEYIIRKKQKIRKLYKIWKEMQEDRMYDRIIHHDSDYTTTIFKFENECKKDVEGWAYEELFIHPVVRDYDCTGCIFTSSIRVFQVGKDVILYHTTTIDV